MKRKDFLKGAGLAGLGLALPLGKTIARNSEQLLGGPDACVLIPAETAGLFPLDLTANNFYHRKDIREGQPGILHKVKMKIIGQDNCLPLSNVRVNIWHCDEVGNYSGYGTEVGKTYLRGYQITDANGIVEFITSFPGWYPGRICHIHFQVYVNSSYSAVSQLTYPLDIKNNIYTLMPSVYTKGADPLTFNQDNIFSDGYQYQLATLEQNMVDASWDSYLEVTVKGSGVSASGHLEKENAKQFVMHQNYPNPYINKTIIPITLLKAGQVKLSIWNMEGKKLINLIDAQLDADNHQFTFQPEQLHLPISNYVLQLEMKNGDGTFYDFKMMTTAQE